MDLKSLDEIVYTNLSDFSERQFVINKKHNENTLKYTVEWIDKYEDYLEMCNDYIFSSSLSDFCGYARVKTNVNDNVIKVNNVNIELLIQTLVKVEINIHFTSVRFHYEHIPKELLIQLIINGTIKDGTPSRLKFTDMCDIFGVTTRTPDYLLVFNTYLYYHNPRFPAIKLSSDNMDISEHLKSLVDAYTHGFGEYLREDYKVILKDHDF